METVSSTTTILLWIISIAIFLLIIFLIIRIVARKISRSVEEEYQAARYEKYSALVDEIIAETPTAEMTHISKRPGDDKVLQTLLEKKLVYIKGTDRSHVAETLSELGFVDQYVAKLSSSDPSQRATALQVLGDLRIMDTAGNFTEALEDADPDVRLTAVRGLSKIVEEMKATGQNGPRARPLIETIVSLLDDPDRVPARRLAEAILDLETEAVPALLVALESTKPRTRALSSDLLGQIGDWRAVDPLIKKLQDREPDVRTQAAGALGGTGDSRAVKPLIKSLEDDAWPVRARAAKSLASIGNPAAVHPLSQLLSDPQWWVRYNAGFALPAFNALGYETLEKTLLRPDRYARERALEVMEETGYLNSFIEDLADTNEEVKAKAMRLLIIVGNAGGLAPLIDATREISDPRSIGSIIEIWREITEQLIVYLNSDSDALKMQSIEAINKMNYSYVVEKILLFGRLDIDGTAPSVIEINQNMEKIRQSLDVLKQDFNMEVREEATLTFGFMEWM